MPKASGRILAVAIDACGLPSVATEASLTVESSCGAEGSAGCAGRCVELQQLHSRRHDGLTDAVSCPFDAAVRVVEQQDRSCWDEQQREVVDRTDSRSTSQQQSASSLPAAQQHGSVGATGKAKMAAESQTMARIALCLTCCCRIDASDIAPQTTKVHACWNRHWNSPDLTEIQRTNDRHEHGATIRLHSRPH